MAARARPTDRQAVPEAIHAFTYPLGRAFAGTVQDFIEKLNQDTAIKKVWDMRGALLDQGWGFVDEFVKAGPLGATYLLRDQFRIQTDMTFNAALAGLWCGLGGTLASIAEEFLSTGQLAYAYKTLMFNTAIIPRMRRRYNTYWSPNYPGLSLAWRMYKHGLWTKDQAITAGQYEGWTTEHIEQILDVWSVLPTALESFYIWRKGKSTEDQAKKWFIANGYDESLWPSFMENFWYTPTVYDLCRLADFIEMPEAWTIDQLKRRGVKDADAAKIWEMLRIRPLREEVRTLTSKWLWRYRMGRASLTELTDALTELEVKDKEKMLLLETAKLQYEDELRDEQVEILMWKFRTAVITDAEYLSGLITLGIREEKANLMVELQKAMGYLGAY